MLCRQFYIYNIAYPGTSELEYFFFFFMEGPQNEHIVVFLESVSLSKRKRKEMTSIKVNC